MELNCSLGASFVPLDERSQPLAAIRQGEFPMPIPDAWLEYLASPDIRQTCQERNHHHSLMKTCPLLNGLYVEAFGIYCLPVRYGRRDVGILNLYLGDQQILTETSHFVRSLLDTTALALEGLRLQKQEWATVGQQRLFRDRVDIKSCLVDLLNEIYRALDADYAIMMLDESYPKKQSEGICFDDLIQRASYRMTTVNRL